VITPVKTEKQRQKEEIEQRLKRKEAEEAAENAGKTIHVVSSFKDLSCTGSLKAVILH
jgi:hypothetical protein